MWTPRFNRRRQSVEARLGNRLPSVHANTKRNNGKKKEGGHYE